MKTKKPMDEQRKVGVQLINIGSKTIRRTLSREGAIMFKIATNRLMRVIKTDDQNQAEDVAAMRKPKRRTEKTFRV
jgi:hypothetical protein